MKKHMKMWSTITNMTDITMMRDMTDRLKKYIYMVIFGRIMSCLILTGHPLTGGTILPGPGIIDGGGMIPGITIGGIPGRVIIIPTGLHGASTGEVTGRDTGIITGIDMIHIITITTSTPIMETGVGHTAVGTSPVTESSSLLKNASRLPQRGSVPNRGVALQAADEQAVRWMEAGHREAALFPGQHHWEQLAAAESGQRIPVREYHHRQRGFEAAQPIRKTVLAANRRFEAEVLGRHENPRHREVRDQAVFGAVQDLLPDRPPVLSAAAPDHPADQAVFGAVQDPLPDRPRVLSGEALNHQDRAVRTPRVSAAVPVHLHPVPAAGFVHRADPGTDRFPDRHAAAAIHPVPVHRDHQEVPEAAGHQDLHHVPDLRVVPAAQAVEAEAAAGAVGTDNENGSICIWRLLCESPNF